MNYKKQTTESEQVTEKVHKKMKYTNTNKINTTVPKNKDTPKK